jgi:hypothetical protein
MAFRLGTRGTRLTIMEMASYMDLRLFIKAIVRPTISLHGQGLSEALHPDFPLPSPKLAALRATSSSKQKRLPQLMIDKTSRQSRCNNTRVLHRTAPCHPE